MPPTGWRALNKKSNAMSSCNLLSQS